jgi:hypothetical protein
VEERERRKEREKIGGEREQHFPDSHSSITDVDPPGSRFLAINESLTITVTFSSPPYNASQVQLAAYDAVQIMNAFYLILVDGMPVFPFNVKPSLDRTKWTVSKFVVSIVAILPFFYTIYF